MPQALNRVSLDLDVVLVTKIDAAARARGCSRAKLVRDILALYFSKVPDPVPTVVKPPTLEEEWATL